MKTSETVTTKKVSEIAYERLEKMLIDGTWRPGDQLPTELELSKALNVSRSALREALQQLKGRGVVEATAGRGMFFRQSNFESLQSHFQLFAHVQSDPSIFLELMDFRLMIEPSNAELCAQSTNQKFIIQLKAHIKEMECSVDNLPTFLEADLDMHLLLAQEAGNRFIQLIMSCIKPLGKQYGRVSNTNKRFVNETLEQHRGIAQAIIAKDQTKAKSLMKKHLKASISHYRTTSLKP